MCILKSKYFSFNVESLFQRHHSSILVFVYAFSFLVGLFVTHVDLWLAIKLRNVFTIYSVDSVFFRYALKLVLVDNLVYPFFLILILNLIVSSFLLTTLPGFLPFGGIAWIFAITFIRGFSFGLVYPDLITLSNTFVVLLTLSIFFRYSAYMLAGVYGINISLFFSKHVRYRSNFKFKDFIAVCKDAIGAYVNVLLMLALSAFLDIVNLSILILWR